MSHIRAPFAPPEAYAEDFDQYGIRAVTKPRGERPDHSDVTDDELRNSISHVATSKKAWARDLSYKELERLFNLASATWDRSEDLRLHVQQTVRESYPERNYLAKLKFVAYVAGIMWIFLRRNNTRRKADARKRKDGVPVPLRTKQRTTPVDVHDPPQRLLL